MINIPALKDRLANQIQRAELAERAGQVALAAKFAKLAAETTQALTKDGFPNATATAMILGLAPGRVPPTA